MGITTIIVSIVVTVAGIVIAAFITGTVVYLIQSLKDLIKENSERSETGDNNIKNELQIMHSQNVSMRKEDRERYNDDIKALKSTDEDRRQDIRKIFDMCNGISDRVHESDKAILRADVSRLKAEIKCQKKKGRK
jgi:polyhydroxyalkanoate synthesis regulator phasin